MKLNLQEFKEKAEILIYLLEDHINTMPDKQYDSIAELPQKVLIKQSIGHLKWTINGLEKEDLIKNIKEAT